ncbi:SDR family oxidoreductase [Polymorphospora sp. NPDC050346]|uniref:SDR family oxidoreductase n=1 Tax=Polymorphospora sp. NPDC050346 TaxID=3155780 RepID=UPI0033C0734C
MITVTGATGHLGRLVVEQLLDRGVPAAGIVAAVRAPEKAADLAARGVQVREADYDRPETLAAALAGTDRLLLVSGNELGQRLRQHGNVVEAARSAGVSLLAYTSILAADTTSVPLGPEHKATEDLVRASGLPYVLLRNGWYLENYDLAGAVAQGVILGAAGEGRVSAATRADFAAAAVAVLTGDGHAGKVYELGGDEAFTLAELAAEVTRQSGTEVAYRDLPVDEYARTLAGFGLPEPVARMLADSDAGLARGDLHTDSGDLSRLVGRPTTPLPDAVAQHLKP